MKTLVLLLVSFAAACASAGSGDSESARWKRQAADVTITRDDWGIPHIHGKTDADAVFGLIYAQAEDDFNRVETNYLNSMGRLAEAEGERAIWKDLRMKLFIDPDSMRAMYATSPEWLKTLMNAWADGLNYYLATHPQVTPRVIRRFEPWMALTFSEGSIGGDIEKVNLGQLEAFYGGAPSATSSGEELDYREPSGSNDPANSERSCRSRRRSFVVRMTGPLGLVTVDNAGAAGLMREKRHGELRARVQGWLDGGDARSAGSGNEGLG